MAVLTFTIHGNKWADFKKYFLLTHPNQTTQSTNPLSDEEWIQERCRLFIQGAYVRGVAQEWEETHEPVIDANIVT